MSDEYCSPERVHIYKPDTHPIDGMVRVYCVQHATEWKLQVRGPLSIGCNATRKGKSSIIASAGLSLPDMISLRDALSGFITEAQSAIAKSEGRS